MSEAVEAAPAGPLDAGLRQGWKKHFHSRPSWLVSISVGVGAALAARLLRLPFETFLQGTEPLMPYIPATLLVGYTTGVRAATVTFAFSLTFVIMGFEAHLRPRSATEALAALAAFSVIGGAGLLLAGAARSSTMRLAMSERAKTEGEARYRLLAREFEHRLANVVTVTGTLAAMSARRGETAQQMLGRLQPRLSAYARAQSMLLVDGDAPVPLRAVVDAALQPFLEADTSRILIEPGEVVGVSAASATVLTLALHELATNAIKYGALKTDGTVRLGWRCDGAGFLQLLWTEAGGPPVVKPERSGFGSALISQAIAQLPDASASVVYSPEGARCEIKLRGEPITGRASTSAPGVRRPF